MSTAVRPLVDQEIVALSGEGGRVSGLGSRTCRRSIVERAGCPSGCPHVVQYIALWCRWCAVHGLCHQVCVAQCATAPYGSQIY